MDPCEMLDYALGRLEGRRRDCLEHAMARDQDFAERITRLKLAIHWLLDDDWDVGRPPVLAFLLRSTGRAEATTVFREPPAPTANASSRGEHTCSA